MSDVPSSAGDSNCDANLSQEELLRLADIVEQEDCLCAQDVGECGQLVLTTHADLYLVVEDEEEGVELSVLIGSGRTALVDLIKAAEHLLTHIN